MTQPGDFHDLRSLDGAFHLPDLIEDPRWRQLYEVLVARMRDEASHLPMNTVQQLLIERIAYNYIVLRVRESATHDDPLAFSGSTQQKDYNTFWLSMTQEFNKQLNASDRQFKETLLSKMTSILHDVVDAVEDPDTKRRLRNRVADALDEAGI